jgi:hypothetical protein
MTDARRPYHLAVYLGLATATYAAVLAAVTGLQSATEAAERDSGQPTRTAIERLADGHDRLEGTVDAVGETYARSVAGYEALLTQLSALESSLEVLRTDVSDVAGTARHLPDRAPMPPLAPVTGTVRAAPPSVDATTGASGG